MKNLNNNRNIKYCSVKSCKYFRGTKDGIVQMFRFPKNRDIAEKWNSSLGIEANKILHGFVCFEHFENECFKRKDKSRLSADAVPTIFETQPKLSTEANSDDVCDMPDIDISSDVSCLTSAVAVVKLNESHCSDGSDQIASPASSSVPFQIASFSSTRSTPSSTIAIVNNQSCSNTQCKECVLKDDLIEAKEAQIKKLRSNLIKAQKKVWYLESVKRKLNTAFSELKKQSLVDEELSRNLEVLKNDDLFRILHHGIKGGAKYPEKVRHFCLGLVSYSPRAYQFIRKTFNNHLPSLKTIQNWFANSDIRGDPGIQEEQMERLRKIAEDYKMKHKRELMCSLVYCRG